jgi:hypothetical protein
MSIDHSSYGNILMEHPSLTKMGLASTRAKLSHLQMFLCSTEGDMIKLYVQERTPVGIA